MWIENQFVEVTWHNQTRKHYEDLGYTFTKYRDKFLVRAEDLSCGTHHKIKVQCDYCGCIYDCSYVLFLRGRQTGKDCCAKCRYYKYEATCLNKYGVKNTASLPDVKEKIQNTFIQKYGVTNPFANKDIQLKIKEHNLQHYGNEYAIKTEFIKDKVKKTMQEKYGVENPFASKDIQERIKQTNIQKYGVANVSSSQDIQLKKIQNCLEKYGVPYYGMVPEIKQKIHDTLYQNGSVPTSKMEKAMCDMLIKLYGSENCFPGYAFQFLNFDCLLTLNNYKIDVEYDGWYWHKSKIKQDTKRNYFLLRRGFKIIRFRSLDALPTEDDIKCAVNDILDKKCSIKIVDLDINV